MRKVTVSLKINLVMSVNEGIEISEVISGLDCQVNDTTTSADILDVTIEDHEVVDSK